MTRHAVIAAGGSGGHVLPAQVVAEELSHAGVTVSFAAAGLSGNPFFERSQWFFRDIAAASPALSLRFMGRTAQGIAQALSFLRKQRPSLVVGFGSYHISPVLTAAILCRIPIVLYAADAVPGRAVRLFAPFARWTGCFFKEAMTQIRGTAYHVTFPLRRAMLSPPAKEDGRSYFGFKSCAPVVLVIGGSQGAKFLNTVIPIAMGSLATPPLIIHLAGHTADIDAIHGAYAHHGVSAVVRSYEPAMHFALAASDLVIARSGASTIAEVEAFCKPAIYIPYPQAMDDHQKKNADLASRRGRAVVIDEKTATANTIADAIDCLLEGCSQKCEYQQQPFTAFVTQLLQTLDEVSLCQKR